MSKPSAPSNLKGPTDPHPECDRCERLRAFVVSWRDPEPTWHNQPVRTFGDPEAQLLIVGLAPGLKGANRTGRPFTGDYAGDLLYETLGKYGFTDGQYDRRPDDGLQLKGAAITNAVRCVPPQNKPTGAEIANCRPFLSATIAAYQDLKCILALGRIAHESVLRALSLRLKEYPFTHGGLHDLPDGPILADSYHCSRYNTNTGRLTPEMFDQVFAGIASVLNNGSE
ncbi:MAG: uracil-DNA glycosylase [Pseudomonadota bacterium]